MGKNVAEVTNTHVIREELFDASFSMQFVSYHRKLDDKFLSEILVISISRKISRWK
jgi:hypothetical protein